MKSSNRAVVRASHKARFTIIDNGVIEDARLSLRARGIMALILCRPDDWQWSAERIASEAKEGRDAVRAALAELEAAGYLRRYRENIRGRWRTRWQVWEVPPRGIPAVGLPAADSQASALSTQTKYSDQDSDSAPTSGRWRDWHAEDRTLWAEILRDYAAMDDAAEAAAAYVAAQEHGIDWPGLYLRTIAWEQEATGETAVAYYLARIGWETWSE